MIRLQAVSQVNRSAKETESKTFGVALEQEDNNTVLIFLTDAEGRKIEGSEFLRITEDTWNGKRGTVYVARIVARQKFSNYLSLDDNHSQIRMT